MKEQHLPKNCFPYLPYCKLLCCPVLKTEPTATNMRPSETSGPRVRGKISINIDEIGIETRGILRKIKSGGN